ncbi:hypothetical protein CHLNCDRAFT_140335 [Chlorella variabilis]|uniref:rRNA biogenesis protein RRP36 n=1 Tax=Chlorella variabilis TaxID=554065 RepID=E1Z6T1_CHLVA|nr:hypothetical protein CHLNCDRAFT_140335 [Chlorella variabilis]EFN58403.1 hypothetical protein CHLNCDRAFT_140335 [Chlorella variabilis]|eukprot:XP_005850505.1 hypothetical protein CHLNCDRAFT_140335 [Chlorella variabilis]
MKRSGHTQQQRPRRADRSAVAAAAAAARPPPPAEDSSDDEEPEQAPVQAKRPRRMVPEHASSSSDSEGGSGDSQSDTETSNGGEQEEDEDEGLPLGQLVALRQDGSASADAMKARARALRHQGKASFKREGKHRPVEMSSKKPVPVFRDTLQGGKRDVRDPRFESLSGGQYKEEQFKRRYAFLYDDKLPAERAELRAALGKAKGGAAREALQARMQHVEQQLRSEEARRKREGFKQQVKAKERASVKDGKRPFYLKKSEQRRLELVAKYEELKAAGPGKLEQYLTKRRKRNAAKDHRHLPAGRRAQAGSGEQ